MTNKQMHEARMENYVKEKVKKIVKVIFIVIFGAIAITLLALLFGYVVMLLWNWLMPSIFGIGAVTFWQAVGIVVLAKLLFGGFGGWGKKSKKEKNFEKRIKHRLRERCSENGIKEWRFYDEYWAEEGKAAYEVYVAKKKNEERGLGEESGTDEES